MGRLTLASPSCPQILMSREILPVLTSRAVPVNRVVQLSQVSLATQSVPSVLVIFASRGDQGNLFSPICPWSQPDDAIPNCLVFQIFQGFQLDRPFLSHRECRGGL